MTIQVLKRNGEREPLDLKKFHKVTSAACDGLAGVSASEVELRSQIQFFDGISTSEIQETLIKAAADLISEDSPNYQYVAGRLINYHIRKQAYGSYTPPHLLVHYGNLARNGYYSTEFKEWFTNDEWDLLDSFLDHQRDELFTYAAMEQFREKYLVQNRVTKQIYETPQFLYLLIAISLFGRYPQKTRMKWIKQYYDAISQHYISLPTPIMAGLRTPQKQFSSCVVVESDDSLDSINATASAIVKYASQKAGLGIGVGRIRAINSPIRNGDTYHTGIIPFIKYFDAAVNSCSQGSVRKGSATVYFPIWHLEIESLLVLKNNKGTEETRVRTLDYGVQLSKVFYQRLIENKEITLFSPHDVPLLYEAFFGDPDLFEQLYIKAENNTKLRKKKISAIDLFTLLIQERLNTGRIYIMNVDHCNTHSSFNESIKLSNLCTEITLPTTPLNDISDTEGQISLCTLSAMNFGKFKHPEEMEKYCILAVRALDSLLSYQNYPIYAAAKATEMHRPLGIGIINFAYWLAKNDMSYSNPNLEVIDKWIQLWSYYLIKASADIAKEKREASPQVVEKYGHSKYENGTLPIDTYKKDVDLLVPHVEYADWGKLRDQIKQYGIRNSTLMALMPSETSAQISNATNGIEPPRALVSIKKSKNGVLKQVVPEIKKLKNKYELLWDIKSNEGYLNIVSVMQKYIDQSISVNTNYVSSNFPNNKISLKVVLNDLLTFYRYGGKCLYYCNTNDGAGEIEVATVQTTAQDNVDEETCDSCAI